MHAFDVLGDPVRRRILELLADGELSSGAVTAVVQAEFGISQPAVSQHLKVLRDNGFASVRPDGARRLYAVDAAPLQEVDMWLDASAASGISGSIRSRPSWRAAGANDASAPPRPTRRRRTTPHDRHRPGDRRRSQREVGTGRHAAGEGHVVRLRRTYDAPIEDVWDALTNPERIGRWFLPISGDYRLGGRYQFEGNAGGEILDCERPHRLRVSWVYGEVTEPGERLELELRLTPSATGRRRSSSSTRRSSPRSSGPLRARARSASAGTADCSGCRSTCAAGPSLIRWPGSCPTRGARSTP